MADPARCDRRNGWKVADSFAEFMAGLRPLEDGASSAHWRQEVGMKKKKANTLALQKETVRKLLVLELENVGGGATAHLPKTAGDRVHLPKPQ